MEELKEYLVEREGFEEFADAVRYAKAVKQSFVLEFTRFKKTVIAWSKEVKVMSYDEAEVRIPSQYQYIVKEMQRLHPNEAIIYDSGAEIVISTYGKEFARIPQP